MKFSLERYPEIPVRELPSTFEEISQFYHDLNPNSCFLWCQETSCVGFVNKLPLKYVYSTHNPCARCKVCGKCVQAIPCNL